MDALRWLEELRHEMARRKLPRRYVKRLVVELSDHITDYMEDRMSMDAKDFPSLLTRLGRPNDVAETAATEYRKQRFCARHPVVTFVLLPVLAIPLCWATFIFGLMGFAKVLGLDSGQRSPVEQFPQWVSMSLPWILLAMLLVPVAASAVVFCRMAARSSVNWKWPLTACAILAVIGGLVISDVVLPGVAHQGQLAVGLSLSEHPRESQIVQFALPLAIGAWAIWRQSHARRNRYAT